MSARRTPLFEKHKEAGGRFVEFGGWDMPVRYHLGIQREHLAVRTGVGLFDVSHMGEIEIIGQNALAAANRLFTNDLEKVADGQACYTAMCLPDGGIVDDLVVYRFGPQKIFVCCNASNRDKDFAWIKDNLVGAQAIDRGEEYAQLAIQGPKAVALLQRLTSTPLNDIARYWFAEGQIAGVDTLISRTGYTGEDGFELYIPADAAPPMWDRLFEAGDGELIAVGLGARDTLRLEMKYALYGNDIDEQTTPLEAGLGWVTKLDHDFIGRDALQAQKDNGLTRRLVAFVMSGRAIARHGYSVVDDNGEAIGKVTSGTRSPSLGQNIGLAYVPIGRHRIGMHLKIEVRGEPEEATIVKPPFVRQGQCCVD